MADDDDSRARARRFWDGNTPWWTDDLLPTDGTVSLSLDAEVEYLRAESALIEDLVSKAATVVEIGCGFGRLLTAHAQQHPETLFVGIDYAPQQIAFLAEAIIELGLTNCAGVVADAGALPIRPRSADLVMIANQTLGTFPRHTRAATLQEAARVVTSAGRVYVGGYSNLDLAEDCYREWGVKLLDVDHDTRTVHLQDYSSLWATSDSVAVEFQRLGMLRERSHDTGLGFLSVFTTSPKPDN